MQPSPLKPQFPYVRSRNKANDGRRKGGYQNEYLCDKIIMIDSYRFADTYRAGGYQSVGSMPSKRSTHAIALMRGPPVVKSPPVDRTLGP